MEQQVGDRLAARGLAIPTPATPSRPYLTARHVGPLVFLSGKTTLWRGEVEHVGVLRSKDDLPRGRAAAELCALQLLGVIEEEVGLEHLVAIARLSGYVSATSDFVWHADVIDAASELLKYALGSAGEHSRIAIGVASLPGGSPVELEAVIVREEA